MPAEEGEARRRDACGKRVALGSGRLTGCLCRGPFHSCVVVKQLSQRVGIHTNFMFCQHLAMLCQGLKPAPDQQITKLAGEREEDSEIERERELLGLPHCTRTH